MQHADKQLEDSACDAVLDTIDTSRGRILLEWRKVEEGGEEEAKTGKSGFVFSFIFYCSCSTGVFIGTRN